MVRHPSLSNRAFPVLCLALVLAATLSSCEAPRRYASGRQPGGCRQRTASVTGSAVSSAPVPARAHLEPEGRHEALVAGPGKGLQGRPATGTATDARHPAHPAARFRSAGSTTARPTRCWTSPPAALMYTALPGTTGNVGIAAHRDGFFRASVALQLKPDTAGARYAASRPSNTGSSGGSASPTLDDVSVIDPTPGRAVTLVGCYPFYHNGPAPQRFIVRAVPVMASAAAA